jgi:hypothetical protein
MAPVQRHVILMNGPIGVGKTTMGRALARALGGTFIDSDDFRDPAKPWFGQVKTVSEAVVREGGRALEENPILVTAKPLRRRDWYYFKRKFEALGARTWCVTLAAGLDAITDPRRGRSFNDHENTRIAAMLADGYAARPFSDLVIDSGQGFETAAARLADECRRLLQLE